MKNPYDVLGLNSNASLNDIKKSYRKLAKKYHPDLNPGNKEAEKKFKEVSHAFDLIGTEEARAKYDRGETDEQQQKQYEDFQKNRQKSYHDTQNDGGRYSYSFGEDVGGSEFFENLFGSGRRSHSMDFPGNDVTYKLEVSLVEAALGSDKVITMPSGKRLQVKIPAGIESGKKLRFKGLGEAGHGKGSPGDAYVEIQILKDPMFKLKGRDVESELPVNFMDAILGAEVQVPTIDGSVMLKIPSGVTSGSKLRIKGKGAGKEGERGNQIVVIKIVMPKEVSSGLRVATEDLRTKYNYDPRNQ